ncbi:PREDICTED: uncharacterized protein LOC109223292 isoform X2 [Nicotiana attenuata]|uniref:uncharacterized protein LOC109223292 isoform X2 n=1 Tax=Nicotiana attenuata TaxID=49451 RepID=UPI0009051495|nr:PREDICTED: uncharacterized protein LOC109223292 isoform X2 [Nicotiana attenuata]
MSASNKPPSRGFSFFNITAGIGSGGGGGVTGRKSNATIDLPQPQLKLEPDREVYRPGDPVTITVEIKNPTTTCSLLIEKLSFEIKGIEKLDTQWFSTPKPSPDSKQRRGEYVFMDNVTPALISNQIVSAGSSRQFMVRTILPSTIPPSYRGATIRYLYYVRSILSGQYLLMENGHFREESIRDLDELETRIPLQIWVTQKSNGLKSEEGRTCGIVPASTLPLDVYWKEMDADSDWAKINETFDGVEEGYESSRDEVSSVSSYNPMKDNIHRTFGSSLSLQSSLARSSSKDLPHLEGRSSISSQLALPQIAVADVLYDSNGDVLSPSKSSSYVSPSQQLKNTKSFSKYDDSTVPSVSGMGESGASEGFIRGRSYNIRLDDQVLLRFSPKNSESTYYFSDMIGGTLTFFHEEGSRRCLELLITLEMTETISRRFVHPSRRHAPSITKVHSDHHEVVADLIQTSFIFSIPMDGPMSFSTHYVSVQWALRFEFFTTPKNVDLSRYEHPLLVEGREKCEWVLPITVHAPPGGAAAAQTRNDKSFSLEPLWVHT